VSRNEPRKALGKGLNALLGRQGGAAPALTPEPEKHPEGTSIIQVPLASVVPNPNQPRREFDQQALLELSQSIERDGIIQPIIVRRSGETYQIIAGERRWRAARSISLEKVPVIVLTADDEKVLELSIIENIQREDLNPIELAVAFQRMAAELGLSHDQIGERTGKDRVTITNSIRLLQLPEPIQEMIATRKLSAGHARALLRLADADRQLEFADKAIRNSWSVRQIEELTRPEVLQPTAEPKPKKEPKALDPNVKAAVTEMERVLGTRVRIIEKRKGKGSIEIEYFSEEDLDRIYSAIVGDANSEAGL
jgi:ParB family transcriptional regulator, chromosome partitioning protein